LFWLAVGVTLVAVIVGAVVVWRHRASGPAIAGATLDQAIPEVPLVDQHGQATTLAAFRGQVVILAPFLTDCHETCPFTTGAFIELRNALASRHLNGRVALVEVTVDAQRDSPARLAAYQKLTGDPAVLLTASSASLDRLWTLLGVDHTQTPHPYQPDWFTGQPDTYDVGHTDGVFLLDSRGHERIVIVGPAVPSQRLGSNLRRLLNDPSAQPPPAIQGWTVANALDDAIALLHQRVHP
jgi:cytochrome oxidase Cu insertion factor (SCO1/SenC/PrrC family)